MAIADSELKKLIQNKNLIITPRPALESIEGVTIPLHLADEFIDITEIKGFIDPEQDNNDLFQKDTGVTVFYLEPGSLTLAMTNEVVTLPDWLVGRLDGRSRLARLGVSVHITAHRIDPGFHGNIVLEIFNCSRNTIRIEPGMEIGALLLDNITGTVDKCYAKESSTYKDQDGVRL